MGIPKKLRDEINRGCVEAYDPEGNYATTTPATQTTTDTTTETGANGEHPLAEQTQEMFSPTEDAVTQ